MIVHPQLVAVHIPRYRLEVGVQHFANLGGPRIPFSAADPRIVRFLDGVRRCLLQVESRNASGVGEAAHLVGGDVI